MSSADAVRSVIHRPVEQRPAPDVGPRRLSRSRLRGSVMVLKVVRAPMCSNLVSGRRAEGLRDSRVASA